MTFIHILTLTFISMLAANTLVEWTYKFKENVTEGRPKWLKKQL